MAQDIRNMFRENDDSAAGKLPQGHRERFKSLLDSEIPAPRKRDYSTYLKIAALVVVAFGVGFFFFFQNNNPSTQTPVVNNSIPEVKTESKEKPFKLRDVSPEYKKVEDYYLASINVEIAKLTITRENKVLIDSFMQQLSQLDQEYKILNVEIEESGLNEQTVEAMLSNLQFRLELLKKLKNKLNEIKNTKTNSYEDAKA